MGLLALLTLLLLLRLRLLRLGLLLLLWLLANRLSLRELLRGEVGRWLRLRNYRLLLRWLRRWRLLRIWLRGCAPLVRRWARLRLRGYTLGLMNALRLRSGAWLRGVLARLRDILLLDLLGLSLSLSLLNLGLCLGLGLCSLLHCKEVLLLLEILGLRVGHLLKLLHLLHVGSHRGIMHSDHVRCVQCLCSIREGNRKTLVLLRLLLRMLRVLLLVRLRLLSLHHHTLSDHVLVLLHHLSIRRDYLRKTR
jgi:hypothetical protein